MALIKCPNCGEEISDKAVKCPKCGAEFPVEKPQKVCKECGEILEDDEIVCHRCGCPVENQQEEKQTLEIKVKKSFNKKYLVFAIGMVVIIGLITGIGIKSLNKKKLIEQQNAEVQELKEYNQYVGYLNSIYSDALAGASKDTNSLIKDSLVLSKDAELSSSDASEILTATLNGYQMAADQASRVNDILTSIDLESASGADSIGKALMKVASQANNAGVSLEKTSAIIATIKDVTQDSDESIGTAMKSILSRMNQIRAGKFVDSETGESLNDTEKVLKKIGISMRDSNDQFKDSESILDDVANKWNTLDSNSKKATATAMAGIYQYNKFIAMMDNWDKVEKLTNTAFNSDGTANKKFEDNYLNSLEAKTNALKASMESLATNLISDDMYSGVLDGTKAITDFIDKTNLLKGALAGLGTAGGLFVFQQIGGFVKDAVREFSNLGTAMDMLKLGEIDSSGFSELLNLTQNLSKSQTELILSSTALSDAQRVAILTGQGMSTSEAEAAVSAMGLSTANASATASTVSLGTAFKGLWTTLMANPLILVAAGVTAAVTAYCSH